MRPRPDFLVGLERPWIATHFMFIVCSANVKTESDIAYVSIGGGLLLWNDLYIVPNQTDITFQICCREVNFRNTWSKRICKCLKGNISVDYNFFSKDVCSFVSNHLLLKWWKLWWVFQNNNCNITGVNIRALAQLGSNQIKKLKAAQSQSLYKPSCFLF